MAMAAEPRPAGSSRMSADMHLQPPEPRKADLPSARAALHPPPRAAGRVRPPRARRQAAGRGAWLAVAALGLVLALGVAALRWSLHRAAERGRAAVATAVPLDALAPEDDALVSVTVAPGDTLSAIAARYGLTAAELMAINGLADPDSLQVGQMLQVQLSPQREAVLANFLPDSEFVRGPAYLGFDVRDSLIQWNSPLLSYSEEVEGQQIDGAAIVERISRQFSLGPRLLLAYLEATSGQVSGQAPSRALDAYPAGMDEAGRQGLWRQLNWLADRLNAGYYDLRSRRNRVLVLRDGLRLGAPGPLNGASFAVARVLGRWATEPELPAAVAGFQTAYGRLFGDPFQGARPSLDLAALRFPDLALPWAEGETWWMTGGPHGGWADGSAWSALDFVPDGEARGCFVSDALVRAAAPGLVLGGETGQLFLDLDGDGRLETGPVLMHLHLAAEGRAAPGSRVATGDPLGHPSCEGGVSTATHLHLARLYDGEWLAAAGPAPFRLGSWTAWGAPTVYDGGMEHEDGTRREACECRLPDSNAIR